MLEEQRTEQHVGTMGQSGTTIMEPGPKVEYYVGTRETPCWKYGPPLWNQGPMWNSMLEQLKHHVGTMGHHYGARAQCGIYETPC